MESSEIVETIETLHRDARERGLFFQNATDEQLTGRVVTIDGRPLISFGSCSYLGLELHPSLIEGACDAARRYGTQFSCSRGYLSAPPYQHLEAQFDQIFDAHVLVAPTTTLAHQAAFEALIHEKDAIVLDHQVHQSVHQAANLARARGARVEMIKHEELEQAEGVLRGLAKKFRTVWFATDGILSMYGDNAPFALLRRILDIAPNIRLYVDDAHGMSWNGKHGRGNFLAHIPLSERIIVASSLAKAFGCGGGILAFSSSKERERVRMCGGTLLFSGPMQPPMLGAAQASARLHLSDELEALQGVLRERVRFTNSRIKQLGLPLLVENDVPIRFIRLGLPRVASKVAQRMAREGYYLNVSMFPTVPMRRAGLRLSINANHTFSEIAGLLDGLSRHIPEVLEEENLSRQELDELFARAVTSHLGTENISLPAQQPRPSGIQGKTELRIEHTRTIRQLDRAEWDSLLGSSAACSWDAQALVEDLFQNQQKKEHNWTFDYLLVRDVSGAPVGATFFTSALQKDDFLMRDEISREIEQERQKDPYFLASRVVMMGSTLSEGNHLYLDRTGPWREALGLLLHKAQEIFRREEADVLHLRDFIAGDEELEAFLLEQGFAGTTMPSSHELAIDWRDEAGFLSRLSKKKRMFAREQGQRAHLFSIRTHGLGSDQRLPLSPLEEEHLHLLYQNVARRKFRINVFELPQGFVAALLASPAWEIVTLCLSREAGGPEDERPVAWFAAHFHEGVYTVFLCGLDYNYVFEHGAYRQTLYQMIRSAERRGARLVRLGMDADVEKGRYDTTPRKVRAFSQAREHYNAAVLREIVARVGLRTT